MGVVMDDLRAQKLIVRFLRAHESFATVFDHLDELNGWRWWSGMRCDKSGNGGKTPQRGG